MPRQSLLPWLLLLLLVVVTGLVPCHGYSALEDARLIAEYKRELQLRDAPSNHARVARRLVHQADWSAVGSLSTDAKVHGYPMVNVIAVSDGAKDAKSTGVIYFLLTDLDFTGPDWKANNKVTFFFSDDQMLNCKKRGVDPMEPTCPRAMISGQVEQLDKNKPGYNEALNAFISRHPRGTSWISVHTFYLCKLNIENIYVLDYYGGPKNVPVELYYATDP